LFEIGKGEGRPFPTLGEKDTFSLTEIRIQEDSPKRKNKYMIRGGEEEAGFDYPKDGGRDSY